MIHCIQLISMLLVFFTSSMARRFGARPVRNMVLVTEVAAIAVHIRYEPMRRAEGSFGFES